MAAVRRLAVALVAALVAGAVLYQFALRDEAIAGRVNLATPTAIIGSGSDAVAVGPDGALMAWLPVPEDGSLPQLPLADPPKGGRLRGPMLQQARVLGGAPAALRPHVAGSFYGEAGVVVELRTGIELRFGDASLREKKWRAAAAVLADPTVEALDYVDLQAPSRPALGGSGHTLPPLP
ncbi:MAG TPA: cell division protein FtsQ/DivIB [Solirubrobacterales bacterium]